MKLILIRMQNIIFFLIFSEPNSSSGVSKTIKTYSSTNKSDSKLNQVNRELIFNNSPINNGLSSSTSTQQQQQTTLQTNNRQSRPKQKSPSYQKNIETQIIRDVSYDSEDPSINNNDTLQSSAKRSYNYSKTNDQQIMPYQEIVEVDSTNLPSELKNVPLSGDILPGPGTKVTTTVSYYAII